MIKNVRFCIFIHCGHTSHTGLYKVEKTKRKETLQAAERSRNLLLMRNSAVMSRGCFTSDADFHCLCSSSILSSSSSSCSTCMAKVVGAVYASLSVFTSSYNMLVKRHLNVHSTNCLSENQYQILRNSSREHPW